MERLEQIVPVPISGRSGRDGEVGEAIVIRTNREMQQGEVYSLFGKNAKKQALIQAQRSMRG
jgi:ribosomal protein L14